MFGCRADVHGGGWMYGLEENVEKLKHAHSDWDTRYENSLLLQMRKSFCEFSGTGERDLVCGSLTVDFEELSRMESRVWRVC
jgi:hypothetical protein